MATITTQLYDTFFDWDGYEAYLAQQNRSPVVWTNEHMDHMRLPAQIDIDSFLVYVGYRFAAFQTAKGYTGEKLLYSPSYPDIIYSNTGQASDVTASSPHTKIPMSVVYEVQRRAPASLDKRMFGPRKQWKARYCGEFQGEDGQIYSVKMRRWENLVEFKVLARSGGEADGLCNFFEHFMEESMPSFCQQGLDEMVPVGRVQIPDVELSKAGIHYRRTVFWMRTQEFYLAGPVTSITGVDIDAAAVNYMLSSGE